MQSYQKCPVDGRTSCESNREKREGHEQLGDQTSESVLWDHSIVNVTTI